MIFGLAEIEGLDAIHKIPEGVSADIVGHEKKTMTYGLYSGGSGAKLKLDAITKIRL